MKNSRTGAAIRDSRLRAMFQGADDFYVHRIQAGELVLYAYAIDGLVSGNAVSEYIVKPLADLRNPGPVEEVYRQALYGLVYNAVALPCKDEGDAAVKLVNGFCVVLFPGAGAIAFEVKTGEKRNPQPPNVENTVKGAKDAFVETVRTNTSLVRRHLRAPELKIKETLVGKRSLTTVSVIWVAGITSGKLVRSVQKRLNQIDIDGLLTPAAAEQYITGSRKTGFPMLQYTERPDRFCRELLRGRIGLLIDGLPIGYLLPTTLGYLMESAEDEGGDYIYVSCVRVLRYGALLLSMLLPAIYIALAVYHQEMIPLPLLRAMIESKKLVPFPDGVEVIGLLIAFELLQEAGIHLPQSIGQPASLVGGIVVGTAAVEARMISSGALIAVSIAGMAGFALPNRDLARSIRTVRLGFSFLASFAGLFGVTVGVLILLVRLADLRSMGLSYLTPFAELKNMGVIQKRKVSHKYRDEILDPEDQRNQK